MFYNMEIITLTISILALFASMIGIYFSTKVALRAINNQNDYSLTNFILESNKKMIEDPTLLGFYDENHPIIKTISNKIVFEAKKEAFSYYLLNQFEIGFKHYAKKSKKSNEFKNWENWLKYTFEHSTTFRRIVSDPLLQSEYNPDFMAYLQSTFCHNNIKDKINLQFPSKNELLFFYKEWFVYNQQTVLIQRCNEILLKSDFTILNFMEHTFKPQGYTAIWLLAESHLAVHTFPEHNTTFIELCSCSEQKLINFNQQFSTFISNYETA